MNRYLTAANTFWVICALLILSASFKLNMQSQVALGILSLLALPLVSQLKGSFTKKDVLLIFFLFLFWISLLTSQHPYGFHEFITFSVGALAFFVTAHTQNTPHNSGIKGFFNKLIASIRREEAEEHPGENALRKGLWLITITGFIFSAYGIVEFITGPTNRLASFFSGAITYSTFPNAMASFLLFVIPINWLLLHRPASMSTKNLVMPALALFSLLINLSALWLTWSRGAFIAFGCMLLLALMISIKHRTSWVSLCKKLLSGFVLLAFSWGIAFGINQHSVHPLDISDRISSADISSQKSKNERVEFWKGSLQMTQDNPFLGVGPGGFEYFYPQYQPSLLAVSNHPHNVMLKIVSESGIPAALTFCLFLVVLGIESAKKIWEEKRKVVSTFMVIALGLLIHNLLDYNLNFSLLGLLFFVTLGLLSRSDQDEGESPLLFKGTVVLLALIIGTLSLFQGYGYQGIKQAEFALNGDSAPQAEEQLKKQSYAPFKHQGLELQIRALISRKKFAEAETFVSESLEQYPHFHPLLYLQALLSAQQLKPLTNTAQSPFLTAAAKNDFRYHLLDLFSSSFAKRQEKQAEKKEVLKEYLELIAQNAHLTAATLNPAAAERLFLVVMEQLRQAGDYRALLVWDDAYQQLKNTWEEEVRKMNNRYGTDISTASLRRQLDEEFSF